MPANVRAVLGRTRAAIATGWRAGLSMRRADGVIEWSVEGALRRELFKDGLTTPEDQDQPIADALALLSVASFDELELSNGQPRALAAVLAALDGVPGQAGGQAAGKKAT